MAQNRQDDKPTPKAEGHDKPAEGSAKPGAPASWTTAKAKPGAPAAQAATPAADAKAEAKPAAEPKAEAKAGKRGKVDPNAAAKAKAAAKAAAKAWEEAEGKRLYAELKEFSDGKFVRGYEGTNARIWLKENAKSEAIPAPYLDRVKEVIANARIAKAQLQTFEKPGRWKALLWAVERGHRPVMLSVYEGSASGSFSTRLTVDSHPAFGLLLHNRAGMALGAKFGLVDHEGTLSRGQDWNDAIGFELDDWLERLAEQHTEGVELARMVNGAIGVELIDLRALKDAA